MEERKKKDNWETLKLHAGSKRKLNVFLRLLAFNLSEIS